MADKKQGTSGLAHAAGAGVDVSLETNQIAVSIGLGISALLILGIQPLLLSALVAEGRMSEAKLGVVATSEILALAAGSIYAPRLLGRVSVRAQGVIAWSILTLVNAATMVASNGTELTVLRGIAGLLEGVALSASIVVMTYARSPERVNGLFFGLSNIPPAVLGYLLPVFIFPRLGSSGGMAILSGLAAISILGALAQPKMPVNGQPNDTDRQSIQWSLATIFLVIGVILQNAGVFAAWSYIPLMAAKNDLSAQAVGTAVAASQFAGIGGGLLIAALPRKIPHLPGLVLGLCIQSVVAVVLSSTHSALVFISASSLFGFLWVALLPLYLQFGLALDPSRRLALSLPGIGLAGLSAGPFAASMVVGGSVESAFYAAVAMILGAISLYIVAALRHRTRWPTSDADFTNQ